MEEEIKELKRRIDTLEKMALNNSSLIDQLSKLSENHYRMLQLEMRMGAVASHITKTDVTTYSSTISCRKCYEQKEVYKNSCNAEYNICHDCASALITEFDSDNEEDIR